MAFNIYNITVILFSDLRRLRTRNMMLLLVLSLACGEYHSKT